MASAQTSRNIYQIPLSDSWSVKQFLDRHIDAIRNLVPARIPTPHQATALAAIVPLAGILLAVSAATLAATVIGLAVTAPLLVIFSPVLVPAAIAVGLGVTGFLVSAVLGFTGVSSFSWLFRVLRGSKVVRPDPEQIEQAKRRVQEAAGHVGHSSHVAGERSHM